jgi:antitoxin CptB
MAAPSVVEPEELGRLRWRCRRGMKELDVLLARYVNERFCGASKLEQEAFGQLLETQDPLLHAYFLGRERPPAHFEALIDRITANSMDSPERGADL